MKAILWRNRAVAILGLVIMFMPFVGVPSALESTLVIILALGVTILGFAGSRMGGYDAILRRNNPPHVPPETV